MRNDDTDSPRVALSRRSLLAAGGAAATTLLGGCLGADGDPGSEGSTVGSEGSDAGSAGSDTATSTTATDAAGSTGWRATELNAARGEETFTIGSLPSPTIVHSFAVWCPKCERLSNQLAAVADEYTILGLNTDPNEDVATVRDYAEENEFGWRFAVAPTGLTDALVSEFGSTVVNAPSTPVFVVCGDGSVTFLSGGDSTRPAITDAAKEC